MGEWDEEELEHDTRDFDRGALGDRHPGRGPDAVIAAGSAMAHHG
jgi:hypothetical protein